MERWLAKALAMSSLPPEAEGYLLSRGVTEQSIHETQFKVWQDPKEPCSDAVFIDRYGPYGSRLRGKLVLPLRCPRGHLLGFEARTMPPAEKRITRFLLRRANWNPVWIGMPRAMQEIAKGKTPWIFEGYFDSEPMRHVLPSEPLLGSLRARLTKKHVEFLRRFVRPGGRVNLAYDNDETGRKGTSNGVYVLRQVGITCIPRPYTRGNDPGNVWENRGAEGLKEAFGL